MPSPQANIEQHHPRVDLDRWLATFPIESFERTEGPRQFRTTEPGDPVDLWKASGAIITSPADLSQIELVRREVGSKQDLGRAVPVDLFLWRTGAPDKPYLTKMGDVPHREVSRPWPMSEDGVPYTFIAQFCFLDSADIVRQQLPGDVMLVFFRDHESFFAWPDRGQIRIEWSNRALDHPMTRADCPAPLFPVPELAGVIHRMSEYPDSCDAFQQAGHYQYYLFSVTQSTKIGRETFYIQEDPRKRGDELLCTLNSIDPNDAWPFVDLERLPDQEADDRYYNWGRYRMMFADAGCLYFVIDKHGAIRVHMDCY